MPKEFVHAQINFDGPLFHVNPGETMFHNLQQVMQGIAEEGSRVVRSDYAQGASRRDYISDLPGKTRVAYHVIGRIAARPSKGGRVWSSAAVVQVYNEGFSASQGRSLMAAGSEVEGMTRGIASALRQMRSAKALISANLTKGFGD
jgi:hypothetical protein